MPVYEYHCTSCGKDFEYEHRMSDPRRTVCEACGGELERMISRTSFSFKGGGWYKDLYASAKPESAAPDASKSDAPAPAASESKPAASDGGSSSTPSSTPSTPSSTGSGSGSGSAAAS